MVVFPLDTLSGNLAVVPQVLVRASFRKHQGPLLSVLADELINAAKVSTKTIVCL